MSIRLMTRVWDSGQYSGGTLLILLALCDFANDKGEKVFPHLTTLAEKARLSEKQTRRTLETLLEDGVIIDLAGSGITKGVLNIRLNITSSAFRDKMSVENDQGNPVLPAGQRDAVRETLVEGSGTNCLPYIDEPPSNHQEKHQGEPPSTAVAVVEAKSDPVFIAVETFNAGADACPKWAKSKTMTPGRRKVIQARLAEVGLDGWLAAVELAAMSAHLGGPVPTTGSHQGWRMDIGWFSKAENFTKISEGSYAPGRHERPTGLASIAAGMAAFLDGQT